MPAPSGALLGSFARGDAHRWSDIDLVVLSPRFDGPLDLASPDGALARAAE